MRNFLAVAGLSAVLLCFGLFTASQVSEAQQKRADVVSVLLELPAPPPVAATTTGGRDAKARADDFYSRSKPPADDAPIEDLIDYWQRQSSVERDTYYVAPMSERQAARLLAEIDKNPSLIYGLLDSLPDTAATAGVVKKFYERAMSGEEENPSRTGAISEGDYVSDSEEGAAETLKEWLKYHTDYFVEELAKEAGESAESDEYVTNQEAVLALARVDWDRARPLLERMAENDKQPVSRTLARWAFYRRAVAAGNESEAARFRERLQATVENKSAKPGERDLAMDALVREGDFAGRDDWYYSLLSDESLYDLRVGGTHYTGLTTLLMHSPAEKYAAKMLELLRSDNKAVRSAAVINLTVLLDEKNADVIRALLPWLENAAWATETDGQRTALINALQSVSMPESVPGLIAVLNEKVLARRAGASMSNSGTMREGMSTMSNRPPAITNQAYATDNAAMVEVYPYRTAATAALMTQKDVRAVPALRAILPQVEPYERLRVVGALYASGGYTIAEQVEGVEAAAESNLKMRDAMLARAAAAASANSAVKIGGADGDASGEVPEMSAVSSDLVNSEVMIPMYNPPDEKFALGNFLITRPEVADDLVFGVAARLDEAERKNPQIAFVLRKILQRWEGAAVNTVLLRDVKNGKADAGALVKLLSLRKDLREKQPNDVFSLRDAAANPSAGAFAACLLEDRNEYDRILAGAANAAEKTALFACARLIRAGLPVAKVAENLGGDKALALAAERYLESEDSPEARRIVLSRHPNEAKILGATTAFIVSGDATHAGDAGDFLPALFASVGDQPSAPQPLYSIILSPNDILTTEKALQKEVREDEKLVGVYAYDSNFVRIYADGKAVFSWEQDEARYRERTLDADEFNRLKGILTASRADEMPPALSVCNDCDSKELLMLGRAGGRRVFYHSRSAPEMFAELDKTFTELREPPARLRYWLEKSVPGLEVLFTDDNLQARAVWKNDDDLRVLVEDAAQRKRIDRELAKQARDEEQREDYDYDKGEEMQAKRREMREYENFAWRRLARGAEENRLGDIIAQPPLVEYIPPRDSVAAAPSVDRQWKARTAAGAEIRVGETDGLFKVSRGQAAKIRGGNYDKPVVSADGRWAVLKKTAEEEGDRLVRVNLTTGKEFVVKIPDGFPFYEPVAYVAPINKFLIESGNYGYDEMYSSGAGASSRKYFLLDAETGVFQPAKGEIRPLAQQNYRPLQAVSGGADEFWAAIPDQWKNETRFGIFNAKTFVFKAQMTIPRIKFDSMDVWADERENKIYFVYQGHLLALPLPKA